MLLSCVMFAFSTETRGDCLVSVLFNSYTETCAGSLVYGNRTIGILPNISEFSGNHAYLSACVVSLRWRPGERWGDPGASGSTRKDTLRSRLGFYRFLIDSVNPFRMFVSYIWNKRNGTLFIVISRLLFLIVIGSESGCLGLENQALGKGHLAKIDPRGY